MSIMLRNMTNNRDYFIKCIQIYRNARDEKSTHGNKQTNKQTNNKTFLKKGFLPQLEVIEPGHCTVNRTVVGAGCWWLMKEEQSGCCWGPYLPHLLVIRGQPLNLTLHVD